MRFLCVFRDRFYRIRVDGGLNRVVGDNYIVFQLHFLTKTACQCDVA